MAGMADVYGIWEDVSRFEIMDFWTDEEREKIQLDREKEGCCELCGSTDDVHWVPSMTRYHWDMYKELEDPNRDLFYCEVCEEYHMEYWDNMWEEYYSSRF